MERRERSTALVESSGDFESEGARGKQQSWGMRERASGTVYMEIAGKVLY